MATALYWKNNRVKCEIALASGKKSHDKRQAIKEEIGTGISLACLKRRDKNQYSTDYKFLWELNLFIILKWKGGDLASTPVAKPEVHVERVVTLVKKSL